MKAKTDEIKPTILKYIKKCDSAFFLETLIAQAEARICQLSPDHLSGNAMEMEFAKPVCARKVI